jgi:hypothetical protein
MVSDILDHPVPFASLLHECSVANVADNNQNHFNFTSIILSKKSIIIQSIILVIACNQTYDKL